MSIEIYHPRHAVENPKEYYDRAFENYPKPGVVAVVGRLSTMLSRPEISYFEAESEAKYFGQFDKKLPLVLTFTHRGIKNLHDPISAAAAVFGCEYLLERVRNIRVWAASPYMTSRKFGPTAERLGLVPVNRTKDFLKFGIIPTEEQKASINNELFSHSVDHLSAESSTLVILPAGTKGGTSVKDGVGRVLEMQNEAVTIPIVMVSDTETTHNRPKNLRVAFGEPIESQARWTVADYVTKIDRNLNAATASIGG